MSDAAGSPLERRASSFTPQIRELCRVVSRGRIEATKSLLEGGCDPNLRHRGAPVLHHFCKVGCRPASAVPAILRLLLQHGADLSALDDNGNTVLHAVAGSPADGGSLASKVIAAVKEKLGDEALHKMINAAGFMAESALHLAARVDNSALVALLLENGADANRMTNKGYAALHSACQALGVESARLLIEVGKADVNAVWKLSSEIHETPLSIVRAQAAGLEACDSADVENVDEEDDDEEEEEDQNDDDVAAEKEKQSASAQRRHSKIDALRSLLVKHGAKLLGHDADDPAEQAPGGRIERQSKSAASRSEQQQSSIILSSNSKKAKKGTGSAAAGKAAGGAALK